MTNLHTTISLLLIFKKNPPQTLSQLYKLDPCFCFCVFFLQEAVTKTGRLHVSLYKHNKPPCVYRWARQFPVFSPSVLNPQTFQKLRFKKKKKTLFKSFFSPNTDVHND